MVKFLHRYRALKTYKVAYEEVSAMHTLFDGQLARNKWCIKPRLLGERVEHFGPKAEQLKISSENGWAAFKSLRRSCWMGKVCFFPLFFPIFPRGVD